MSDVPFVDADGKRMKIDYRSAFLKAERMLCEIDILCSPDRKGHRRKDALDKIQDLVMTRGWQIGFPCGLESKGEK